MEIDYADAMEAAGAYDDDDPPEDDISNPDVQGEYDDPDSDDATHTTCMGHVFSTFVRGNEFVIDAAITDSE